MTDQDNLFSALYLVWKGLHRLGVWDLARGDPGSRPGASYDQIRNNYIDDLAGAMNEYLNGSGSITRPRNMARRAILTAFDLAFYTGYVDGGGSVSEMLPEDRDWFLARTEQEIGFVDMLFQNLKAARAEAEDTGESLDSVVSRHASGYARTLDAVYSEGKLRGSRNIMLALDGPDGQESCKTCQRLKGKRHSARWWIDRGLVPEQGNANYDCGGWQCQHRLFDDQGDQYTP